MKPYLIGLTGNIGCGKSAVAAMLEELGAEVVDADRLVHQLMEPGTDCWRAIAERFGPAILRADDTIDRSALGEIVFRDQAALAALESILHPATWKLTEARIASSTRSVVVLEAIKLIEAGWVDRVDSLWVVTCSREKQMERLTRDRGLTAPEALLRIDAQPAAGEKVKRADVVIDNGGTLTATRRQVEAAWDRMPRIQP